MVDLISASSLAYAPELISELGGDPAVFFTRAGIGAELSGSEPPHYIKFSALSLLLTLCADELQTPDFALRLAARQHLDILGPIAVLARNAKDAAEALSGTIRFAHVYSPAIAPRLSLIGDEAAIEFSIMERHISSRAQSVERAFAVILLMLRSLCGEGFRPSGITFQHDRVSSPRVYFDYFRCPVAFAAPNNAMTFPAEVLQRPLEGNPLIYDMASQFMAGQAPAAEVDAIVAVCIRQLLPANTATLKAVASFMAMHPRTLQRNLSATGHTFESLLDGVRRDLARELLADGRVPLVVVAHRLGYADQSCLVRSSRRWFGVTPAVKRRELLNSTRLTRRY